MIIMQVSLYPLGEKNIDKKLNIFWELLEKENLNYKITPLSTLVWGNDEENLYNIIFKAYQTVRKNCPAVMVLTMATGDKVEIDKLIGFLK